MGHNGSSGDKTLRRVKASTVSNEAVRPSSLSIARAILDSLKSQQIGLSTSQAMPLGPGSEQAKQIMFEILAPRSVRLERLFAAYELAVQKIPLSINSLGTTRETRRFLYARVNEFAQLIPKDVLAEHLEQIARRMVQWARQVPRQICVDFVLLSSSQQQNVVKVNLAGIGQVSIKLDNGNAGALLYAGRVCQVVKIGSHYILIVDERKDGLALRGVATGNTNAAKSKKRQVPRFFAPERMHAVQFRQRMIACPLCGARVSIGGMLGHKRELHGEAMLGASTKDPKRYRALWVPVVQGGAPTLGRNKS